MDIAIRKKLVYPAAHGLLDLLLVRFSYFTATINQLIRQNRLAEFMHVQVSCCAKPVSVNATSALSAHRPKLNSSLRSLRSSAMAMYRRKRTRTQLA